MYELTEEDKVPIMKNWVGIGRGFAVNTNIYKFQGRYMQNNMGIILTLGE